MKIRTQEPVSPMAAVQKTPRVERDGDDPRQRQDKRKRRARRASERPSPISGKHIDEYA